jgi:hypothetical protein
MEMSMTANTSTTVVMAKAFTLGRMGMSLLAVHYTLSIEEIHPITSEPRSRVVVDMKDILRTIVAKATGQLISRMETGVTLRVCLV